MTQDGFDPEDGPEEAGPLPDARTVLAEIEHGVPLSPNRLRALSEPDQDVLRQMMVLWPKMPPERRRELLAAFERLSEEDGTLDFHRLALTAMRDSDAATRILAVRGLMNEDRPEYMHLLLGQLRDDPEASVRAEVADVLGQFVVALELGLVPEDDGETLIASLRDVIDDIEEQDEVRARALEALGALSDETTAETISDQYEVGSHRMRMAALRAMGRSASDGWLDLLVYHFDDEDAEIRAVAAEAAGALLADAAVGPLILLAQEDKDEDVQVAAILALGEIATEESERVLTRWLSERHEPHIQDAIRDALAEVHLMTAEFYEDERDPELGDEPRL